MVGASIFAVFNWLDSGGEFKGDGSYGSKGKELVTSIRMYCDDLMRKKLKAATYEAFIQEYAKDLKRYILPTWKRSFLTWWHGRDVFK